MRIATQRQLIMSKGQYRQCGNASGATWPILKLEQFKKQKVEKKFKISFKKVLKKVEKKLKTLPEAQRTQGIESMT